MAAVLEFFQYLTDLPVFGTMANMAVVIARKTVGPAKNVLKMEELRQYASSPSGTQSETI